MQDNLTENTQWNKNCMTKYISQPLVIVGALNWGLIGAFDFNLVAHLFGIGLVSKIVYCAVGVAGLFEAWCFAKKCTSH